MPSKLVQAGEVLIDHTNSPGLTLEWAAKYGVAGPIVPGGVKYESGTKNCKHCGAHVYLNPMRQRDREWCMVCDAYICDPCAFLKKQPGYVHQTVRQILTELYEATQRGVSEI